MHLPRDQKRIDHGAVVVDRGVARQRDHTGFWIDFDFGDMTAVREGMMFAGEFAACRADRHRPRGRRDAIRSTARLGDTERPVADIGSARACRALRLDVLARHVDGRPAKVARELLRAVTRPTRDVFRRHAEEIGDDLVSLADGLCRS